MLDPARALTGLSSSHLAALIRRLRSPHPRSRPWALPLEPRVVIACTSLRTNLTVRELAAVFAVSRAQAHRIVVDIVQRLANLLRDSGDADRRWSWIVDGTLVPTRDHTVAAKSKNYRWSCNAQVLIRRAHLHVIAVAGGGPGNRNDPVHYRGSQLQRLCRNHGRVLADGGYRGSPSSSHRCFEAGAWSVISPGDVTGGAARVSSTPSAGSKTGEYCVIIGAADYACRRHCAPSRFLTTSGSNYETTLSSSERRATSDNSTSAY